MEKKNLFASSFGNILEWLDVGLFIYLAPIIGQVFFPKQNSINATIIALGVFAAGFICRPLGSIFFGHLGDRIGRVKTLLISILTISFVTLMVGLLPGYSQIGLVSPILFTLCRLVQGLSIGGEYSGIMIYLAESSPSKKRGFYTSFAAVGSNLGFLVATLIAIALNTLLPESMVAAWGWRIPFIFSGLLGFLIFFYRLNLIETSTFIYLKSNNKLARLPLLSAIKQAPKNLLQILGLTCMGSTFYFVFFGYMPSYLSQYFGTSLILLLSCQAIFLTLILVFIPLVGWAGDKFGRKKILYLVALGIILFSYPCFYLLHQSVFLIFIGMLIATVISSLEQGSTLITIVENCPAEFRFSGVSFAYHMGNTLFGGTAPLVVGLLTQKVNHFAPAYYLMLMGLISLIVIFTLNTKHQHDTEETRIYAD